MLERISPAPTKIRNSSTRTFRFRPEVSLLVLGIVLLLIPGCVSRGKSAKKTLAVKETNALNMQIQHYYDGDYFVHIAKDGGKWHVVDVTTTKPKDFDSKDELVSFNRAMTITGPAFHHKMPEDIIGCTAFDGASSTYTICNSEFGDANVKNTALITVMTLGISAACGGGYAVSFDEKEYVEIVKESGAAERVQNIIQAERDKETALAAAKAEEQRIAKAAAEVKRNKINALREEASAFINDRVNVTPNVIDKSGFHADEKVISVSKKFGAVNENSDIRAIPYSYVITPEKTDFHVTIPTPSENLSYTDKTLAFRPVVTIESKDIPNLALNYTAANKDLAISLRGVGNYGWGDLFMRLENSSSSFITVDSISFYVGKAIRTNSDLNIKLPPNSQGTYFFDSTYETGNYFSKFTRNQTKAAFSKARPQIGIAASYTKDGADKSLFDNRKIKIAATSEEFPQHKKAEPAEVPTRQSKNEQEKDKSGASDDLRHYAGNIYFKEIIQGTTYTVHCGDMAIGGVVTYGPYYIPTNTFGESLRRRFRTPGAAIEFVGEAAGCF